jgi:RNA-directed DNA polymerase
MTSDNKTKQFDISKRLVWQAYKATMANAGAAGIDAQTCEGFKAKHEKLLYKIWNRMSSGTYFPPPVKLVEIPKKGGGKRALGIPTVSDRIAQRTVKAMLEPAMEKIFVDNSYGYRPNKSALDAVGVTRERCWRYRWLLEFDIKQMFDMIPHNLLLKALDKHTENKAIRLYVRRWLTSETEYEDGSRKGRTAGTPQGGVISPLLANLFMHYAFDKWMERKFPHIEWCRYADDGVIHCKTEGEAKGLLEALRKRMKACGLELHPEKTRIVYCGTDRRKYPNRKFEFLGYEFRLRCSKNRKTGACFTSFTPAISKRAIKGICATIRALKHGRRTNLSLQDIAKELNPKLMGWWRYYGKYYPWELNKVWRCVNGTLVKWAKRKFKKLKRSGKKAVYFMLDIAKKSPNLFYHWRIGMKSVFI